MKYYEIKTATSSAYIAAFSAEFVKKKLARKIKNALDANEKTFTLYNTTFKVSEFTITLKVRSSKRLQLKAYLENNEFRYVFLDEKKFSIKEDDTLSAEFFYPQEVVYNSILEKEADTVLTGDSWFKETPQIEESEFLSQVLDLVEQKKLTMVYKLNSSTFQPNPWTDKLTDLSQEFRLPGGELFSGRDPKNILIGFKKE